MDSNLATLMERAGSQLKAASLIGVSCRHVQNWCAGHSSPSKSSKQKILLFLEGDHAEVREGRIKRYEIEAIAQCGGLVPKEKFDERIRF